MDNGSLLHHANGSVSDEVDRVIPPSDPILVQSCNNHDEHAHHHDKLKSTSSPAECKSSNGTTAGDRTPPSYVGISCSVSGYGRRGRYINGSAVGSSSGAGRVESVTSRSLPAQAEVSLLSTDQQHEPPVGDRSFVRARIERLYGPGALCSGFRRMNVARSPVLAPNHPSPAQSTPSASTGDTQAATPPVFRHLRAEFRRQLPLVSHSQRGSSGADQPAGAQLRTSSAASAKDTAGTGGDSTGEMTASVGHSFITKLDAETARLLALTTRAESDLESRNLSPEVEGKFRAARGKARLLIAQKFQQFRGLCDKNISEPSAAPYRTTSDDLQGFWDMVCIQVEHIDQLMSELDSIRENGWLLPVQSEPPISCGEDSTVAVALPRRSTASGRSKRHRPVPSVSRSNTDDQRRSAIDEKRRALDEKRRSMLQARRLQLQQRADSDQAAAVTMFVTQ